MSNLPLPDLEMVGLARRSLNVILVLDCSGSMTGQKMASLNYAMRAAIPAMRTAAEDNPEIDVLVRVLRFSTGADWHVGEATPVERFEWVSLEAGGETQLGAALDLMNEVLTPEAMPGRQLPPVIVLVSDGHPTDDYQPHLDRLLRSPFGSRAVRVAVAIGSDADLDVLDRFIAHPDFRPLVAHNAEALVDRIKWATTAPVKSVSSPAVAGAHSKLAGEAANLGTADDDLVW